MRRLDLYWMKNKDWWKFENGCTIIKDTAPQDAQESYNRYLLQNPRPADAVAFLPQMPPYTLAQNTCI